MHAPGEFHAEILGNLICPILTIGSGRPINAPCIVVSGVNNQTAALQVKVSDNAYFRLLQRKSFTGTPAVQPKHIVNVEGVFRDGRNGVAIGEGDVETGCLCFTEFGEFGVAAVHTRLQIEIENAGGRA